MNVRLFPYEGTEAPLLGGLLEAAEHEGHRFVARTIEEWRDGTNRFDRTGEHFSLAVGPDPVGMCGINIDPYLSDPEVGRLRHLYVHPDHRRAGVARLLVDQLLSNAAGSFARVRLRTSNPAAAAFYRSMGFAATDEPEATHSINL